jgi:hypothetical protein
MLRSRSVTVKIGLVARRRSVSRSLLRRSFLGAAPFGFATGLVRLRADAFRDVPASPLTSLSNGHCVSLRLILRAASVVQITELDVSL